MGLSLAVPFLEYPDKPPPLGDKTEYADELYLMPFVWKALAEGEVPGKWLGERILGHYPLAVQRRGSKSVPKKGERVK